jgi:hypothetical protein
MAEVLTGADFDSSTFVGFILNLLLADFHLDELRRVINEAASLCESINEMFVVEISFVAETPAEARNADKTAAFVSNFSRISCHRLIVTIWLRLGIGCHTVSRSVPGDCRFAGIREASFKFVLGHQPKSQSEMLPMVHSVKLRTRRGAWQWGRVPP